MLVWDCRSDTKIKIKTLRLYVALKTLCLTVFAQIPKVILDLTIT